MLFGSTLWLASCVSTLGVPTASVFSRHLLPALLVDAMNCTWRRRRLLSPSLVAILTVGVVAATTAARRVAAVEQPAGKADPHSGEFDYYREWGNKHLAPDHAPDGNDAGAKAVYDEYESFVEGVESVMGDQRAAASKRDVVDLGQSLHLLDTKFEHLKESLYEQMVMAAARRGSKGKGAAVAEGQALARKVKSKYTNVRTIARDVLDLMASNAQAVEHVSETMTGLEKVVGELQKNLEQHHKEVTEVRATGLGSCLFFSCVLVGVSCWRWVAVGSWVTSDGLPVGAVVSLAARRGSPLFGMAVPWMVDADLFVPTVYSDSSESVSPAAVALDCPCIANVCVRTLGTGCSWVTLSNGCMTARTRSWIRMLHLRTRRCQRPKSQRRRCSRALCHRRPRSIFCCWSRWPGSVGSRCSGGGGRGSSTLPNSIEPLFLPVCLLPLHPGIFHFPPLPHERIAYYIQGRLPIRAHCGCGCSRESSPSAHVKGART